MRDDDDWPPLGKMILEGVVFAVFVAVILFFGLLA